MVHVSKSQAKTLNVTFCICHIEEPAANLKWIDYTSYAFLQNISTFSNILDWDLALIKYLSLKLAITLGSNLFNNAGHAITIWHFVSGFSYSFIPTQTKGMAP